MLLNIYVVLGMWKEVNRVRGLMKDKGVKKQSVYSWIEFGDKVYIFVGGGVFYSDVYKICLELKRISLYVKNIEFEDVVDFIFELICYGQLFFLFKQERFCFFRLENNSGRKEVWSLEFRKKYVDKRFKIDMCKYCLEFEVCNLEFGFWSLEFRVQILEWFFQLDKKNWLKLDLEGCLQNVFGDLCCTETESENGNFLIWSWIM